MKQQTKEYKVNQEVTFINGFNAQFEGKIEKVYYDNLIGQYHYKLNNVKLIKESDDSYVSKDFKYKNIINQHNALKSILHCQLNLR